MKSLKAVSLGGAALFLSVGACYLDPLAHDYAINPDEPPPLLALPERPPEVVVSPDGYATLSGEVKGWFSLEAVNGVTLSTVGTDPVITGAADGPQGSYGLEVPVAGIFWIKAAKPGYPSTYEYVRMPQGDYPNKTAYIISDEQLAAMAAAYGKTVNPACGTVLAEVKNPQNQGQKDITALTLLGVSYEGPYFLGPQNQAAADRTYSSASGRALFFNVCDTGGQVASPGAIAQLTVDQPGYPVQAPAFLNIYAGGATRGVVVVEPNGVVVEPPPDDIIDFKDEIYPIFVQQACAACHAPGGAAAGSGLYFDGPAENVYAALREGNQRVNLQYPADSLVLSKPLYEEPPNHPNASFPSVNYPDYQTIYRWINQGAPWGVQPPPPPVQPVTFAGDIYTRFQVYNAQAHPYGRGCANCHDAVTYSGGLNLTGGPDVVYQRLADKGLYDVNYPDQSKILRYPYCGPNNCVAEGISHGSLVFANTNDPDYQLIYQWIAQGAQHDGVPPPPPPPDLPQNVDFFDNVQTRFAQRGCTGCHGAVGPSGNLDLTGTPRAVYDRLYNVGQRVLPGNYEGSYLYTKPNAAFPNVNHGGGKPIPGDEDNFSRYLAGWIYENAPFVDPGYMYATDHLAPYFQAQGCTGCHNAAGQANYGQLRLDLTGQNLINELNGVYDGDGRVRLTPYDPANSLIITKAIDLYPNVNHGGGKKQINVVYKEFHRVLTWVYEGAARP
jgi:mono/diheme cytochrome c family protein